MNISLPLAALVPRNMCVIVPVLVNVREYACPKYEVTVTALVFVIVTAASNGVGE
jgi:hypothetical protein